MPAIFLIAVALAMDAFAVSVSTGMCARNFLPRHALLMGAYFGIFQSGMTLIGWFLGQSVSRYVEAYGHFVAFTLLAYIGIRMIVEAVKKDRSCETAAAQPSVTHLRLTVLGVATSVDALVVGVSLAFLKVSIVFSASIIGLVAFALSTAGGLLGKRLGTLFQTRAEIAGGAVLILIGVKILLENLVG